MGIKKGCRWAEPGTSVRNVELEWPQDLWANHVWIRISKILAVCASHWNPNGYLFWDKNLLSQSLPQISALERQRDGCDGESYGCLREAGEGGRRDLREGLQGEGKGHGKDRSPQEDAPPRGRRGSPLDHSPWGLASQNALLRPPYRPVSKSLASIVRTLRPFSSLFILGVFLSRSILTLLFRLCLRARVLYIIFFLLFLAVNSLKILGRWISWINQSCFLF